MLRLLRTPPSYPQKDVRVQMRPCPPSASHVASTFDCVVSGVLADGCTVHSSETLAEFARILKPAGKLILDEAVTGGSGLTVQGHYF